jgi:hypothetical protein
MTTVTTQAPHKTDHATVPVTSLHYLFSVRMKIDSDRVKFIEEQILSSDPSLRPLLVCETPDSPDGRYGIIDGRHRFQAYQNLRYDAVPVIVSREKDMAKLMVMALAANLDGAPQLPPNMGDIHQGVRNLVSEGKSDQWIQSELRGKLTVKTISKATQWARSNRTKGLIRQAANYRDDQDCSYAEAAKKFDVSVDALKDFVSKKKHTGEHMNAEFAKDVSSLNQTYGNGLASLLQRVTEAYRDGLIQEDDAKRVAQRVSDYRHRIEVQCSTFEKRLDKEIV